jgi:asparagine synthase (glutamine-hydrolysing)
MTQHPYVERLVNLLDPNANQILNMSVEQAEEAVRSGDTSRVRQIEGHFALLTKSDQLIRMARSLGRPMRYFLAKRTEGPCLVVAERIDEILAFLRTEGLQDQFHPSYTRMVPAHHVVELKLIGCPDPNPLNRRFFAPKQNQLSTDLDLIGKAYIHALSESCQQWLLKQDSKEPIGVLFSGGIDSGSVFLTLYHSMLKLGMSPTRLKAFTLSIDGVGDDAKQSREFLKKIDMELFLETIEVPSSQVDYRRAIAVIEDYKPLDVQAAATCLAICQGIRDRYPQWRLLVDGDGGDENMKDYPIEDNPELTIRSVLNNVMLYQEGWGVDAVKHSLTYSGGQSRGQVRSWAPLRKLGFSGFSPYSLPNVIEVAEAIPFIELTGWSHDKLYALKGDIVSRGVKQVTGWDMPVFPKRRFQDGAGDEQAAGRLFPSNPADYRKAFLEIYS